MTRKVYIDADGIHFPDMDASWTERNSFLKNVFNEQSAKADYGKAKLSLVPRRIIWDVALESMGTISTLTEDLTTGKQWTYSDIETLRTGTFSGTLTARTPLTTSQVFHIFGIWPAISHFFAKWKTCILAKILKL